jgi:hypothetical protein
MKKTVISIKTDESIRETVVKIVKRKCECGATVERTSRHFGKVVCFNCKVKRVKAYNINHAVKQ